MYIGKTAKVMCPQQVNGDYWDDVHAIPKYVHVPAFKWPLILAVLCIKGLRWYMHKTRYELGQNMQEHARTYGGCRG